MMMLPNIGKILKKTWRTIMIEEKAWQLWKQWRQGEQEAGGEAGAGSAKCVPEREMTLTRDMWEKLEDSLSGGRFFSSGWILLTLLRNIFAKLRKFVSWVQFRKIQLNTVWTNTLLKRYTLGKLKVWKNFGHIYIAFGKCITSSGL